MQNYTLAKLLKTKAVAGSVGMAEFAMANYGQLSVVADLAQKSAVGLGLSNDQQYQAASREFIALSNTKSLIGKISAIARFRRIAPHTPVLAQAKVIAASWVGEGKQIQCTGTDFNTIKTEPLKIGAILPITNSELKSVGPDFERTLNDDLVSVCAEVESRSFIDPANGGVPNESPASILHGVTPIPGTSNPKADIKNLIKGFLGSLDNAVMICSPENAVILHGVGYEGSGARGGDLSGIPLVTDSTVGEVVALVDVSRILLSDMGVELDISNQTTLMIDPDSSGDPQTAISLLQMDMSAIRIIRYLDWKAPDLLVAAYTTSTNWE